MKIQIVLLLLEIWMRILIWQYMIRIMLHMEEFHGQSNGMIIAQQSLLVQLTIVFMN